jgi:valyl-tRNA synthetase
MVVERQMAKEGVRRTDLGRADLSPRLGMGKSNSAERSRANAHLGESVDWSRERFTLDDGLSAAVPRSRAPLLTKGSSIAANISSTVARFANRHLRSTKSR